MKTNLEIEIECTENWLSLYREQGATGWHVEAMERHLAWLIGQM